MKRTDNMNDVQDWGELVPEQWYHVRVAKVKDTMLDAANNEVPMLSKESNEPICQLNLAIQDEPFVGRVIVDTPSLQPHALSKMKRYYSKAGVGILPDGGHDPQLLLDAELYVKVTHEVFKGDKRSKITPFNIRGMMEGPGA